MDLPASGPHHPHPRHHLHGPHAAGRHRNPHLCTAQAQARFAHFRESAPVALGLAAAGVLILLAGCMQSAAASTWMAFDRGQCNDAPWGTPDDVAAAEAFLESRGIGVTEIQHVEHDLVTCAACGCPTGDRMLVLVADSADADALRQMGWQAPAAPA